MAEAKAPVKAPVMVYTVTLANGEKRQHSYRSPGDPAEARKLVEFLVDHISNALEGKVRFLFLQNPSVVYNPTHVACIEMVVFDQDQLEEIIRKAQKGPLGSPSVR